MADPKTTSQDVLNDIESHTPEAMHPILEAAFKHQKQLILAVCVIIALAALYAGYNAYAAKSEASAQAELGAILVKTQGKDRIPQLEALLDTVPASVKPAVAMEIAQASMTHGEYAKAVTYWDMLINETESDMQFAARIGKVKALMLTGKNADALTDMKALADTASEAYAVPVYRQLALTAESAGDTTEALAAYKKLAEKNVADKQFIDYKISQLESE
ncbi:transcriptional regulator [Pseudodesulfovibrio sp. JC047]|uniref:transcriptional regulator n=1 Tax=Pseudodesulfovibrio sp. JC047 TaxID=2683199 RepID=UPI0013D7CADB|nr:transcriptional regulator [Pseudodesulfovibrio sp. JC047]NDV18046.1 transcriptional regulator [Pseudodesulfovibrio sp. JC047]